MASMALTVTSSPQVSKKAMASLNSSPVWLGLRVVSLPALSKAKPVSARKSLSVRAVEYEDEPYRHLNVDLSCTQGEDLLGTSRFALTPWDVKEEEDSVKMWFNMPGVAAQDIRMYIKDRMLFIQGKHLHLPLNIRKDKIKAKLGNGVLFVSVPKTTPESEPYPVKVEAVSW